MSLPTLHQSIVEFLDSASTPPKRVERCACGAPMEYRETTFSYEGREWEIELPVCLKCARNRHAHDA
jgi:hypothetical protein